MVKTVLLALLAVLIIFLVVAGVRLALLKYSLTSYKLFWQKQNRISESNGQDGLVYIALGDSAAQGIGASSPMRGYVGLTADYLHTKTSKKVSIINLSVSGAKIQDVIKVQLPQLSTLPRAAVLTIEIGANDVAVGSYNAKIFEADFEELCTKLPAGSFVANMPSFRVGRKANIDDRVKRANGIIAEVASSYPQLHFVDLYAQTKGQKIYDFGADLFHPSNYGYKNWANAFISAIQAAK